MQAFSNKYPKPKLKPSGWAWARSIRGRLTLLNLGLLGLLFLGLALAQYFFLNNYLNDRLEKSLRSEAKPKIERQLAAGGGGREGPPPGRFEPRVAADLSSRETLALVIDQNGKVFRPPLAPPTLEGSDLNTTTNSEAAIIDQALQILAVPPADLLSRAMRGEAELSYSASLNGWGKALVVLIPLRQNANPIPNGNQNGNRPNDPPAQYRAGSIVLGVAVIAGTTRSNENALAGLLLINVIAFVVLLGAIALISPLVAKNSLEPLRRMIGTTQEIARGDLSRRLQLTEVNRDEVGQLTISFNQMVDQLEKLFKAQRQLVADASHELRTPLTAIKGSLEVLLMGGASDDPAAANVLLKTMYQEADRLTRLVNDLLTLSKLDRGENFKLQVIELGPVLQAVRASIEMLVQPANKAIKLEWPERAVISANSGAGSSEASSISNPAIYVLADPDRLKQVLYNLLDNALKFSPPGSTIWVELEPAAVAVPPVPSYLQSGPKNQLERGTKSQSSEPVLYQVLIIRDQGEGIAPGDLPYIFDRFYRGDASRSRQSQKGGSGLGLAIARTLIEAQQGLIGVESTPGHGSTFYLYLRRA